MNRAIAHALFLLSFIGVLGTGTALASYVHVGWGLACLLLAGVPIYVLYHYRVRHLDDGIVKR